MLLGFLTLLGLGLLGLLALALLVLLGALVLALPVLLGLGLLALLLALLVLLEKFDRDFFVEAEILLGKGQHFYP